MRKLITIILLCLVTLLHAQVGEPRRDLAIGVNGGYVLNKVDFNPSIKQVFHGGPTVGATIRFTCEKYFNLICAIQAEINYAQMGWKELIETSSDTYERSMHYLQMPIFANLSLGSERGGFRGYLVIGPQLGLFLSEQEKKGGAFSEETLKLRPNGVIQQYGKGTENKFEYGITGGLGCEYSTKKGLRFMVEGRYFFSLADIFHNTKQDPFGRSANGAIYIKGSVLFDVIKTKK